MKKWQYRLLIALFALVFLISGGYLTYKYFEGRRAAQDYDEAALAAGIQDLPKTTPPAKPSASQPQGEGDNEPVEQEDPALVEWMDRMRNTDLTTLRNLNREVLGWIAIPFTELTYPLMAHTDNNYYLNHTWLGARNAAGAIFLDGRCEKDFSDFNTIIYGHRMHNNTMFGTLRLYDDLEFWEEHPCVYIFWDGDLVCYDIFAAMETGVTSSTYTFGDPSEEEKQAFIDYALEHSVLDTGIVPTVEDHILTLSTCTQQGGTQTRWVVQAVRRD